MTLWNLIVVVCLMLLYMGIGVVFFQVRRLRDEIRASAERNEPVAVEHEPEWDAQKIADGVVEPILQELGAMEEKIMRDMAELPKRFGEELEEIRREVQFLQRPNQVVMNAPTAESRSGGSKRDAYREAKLLLTNGVDEERVIEETGLTVEEVSLLKRLSSPERTSQQS
ncbi:MAG: hypothetical protein HQL66_00290 [Magnetococcales bacterium]|nr:hypothetical protein [Magnetococcales bacterium]